MKTTSKAIFWIIVVFATGVLCGGALTFLAFHPERPSWTEGRSREKRSPDRLLKSFTEKLELDAQQQEQFRTLLIESRDQFRAAHREASQKIRQATREKLRQILRPDQLQRFDELMAEASRNHPLGQERKPDQ